MVSFLKVFYTADCRTRFPDDCWASFDRITIIVSSVLVSCTSIVAAVHPDIPLISSALDPKNTWTEVTYAWVWAVKSGMLRMYGFFLQSCP